MAERVAVLLASLALLAGCGGPVAGTARAVQLSDDDRGKFKEFYARLNKAGDEGAPQQQKLLKETQHPDFRQKTCDLRGATIKVVLPSIVSGSRPLRPACNSSRSLSGQSRRRSQCCASVR